MRPTLQFCRNGIQLQSFKKIEAGEAEVVVTRDPEDSVPVDLEVEMAKLDAKMRKMAKMLCLAVAYSANIGGMATLTGTPPNLVLDNVAAE